MQRLLGEVTDRGTFADRLERALLQAAREERIVGLLAVGLDRLAELLACHGSEAVERLLADLALRLADAVRASDTVARVEGLGLAVLLPTLKDEGDAALVAAKALALAATPFAIAGSTLRVSASAGVALYPRHGSDGATLLAHANAARQAASDAGGNAWRAYRPAAA